MITRQNHSACCRGRLRQSLILAIAFLLMTAIASDAKRIALVIGNAEYEHVSNIPNPVNDARDIADALGRIGFEVTEKYNLDYREMRLSLRDFSEKTTDAEVVLVYFAGHGIEIDNTNYLIPTNAELKSDKDVEFEAIRLETMLNAVSSSKGLKLVLVDACRNNPFVSDMVRTTATRSIGQGLGRIDPGGVLVGYSARGSTLALDGDGRNSPYAQAILEHIEVPGLELGKLFRKVRDSVFDQTEGYQEPFTYGSLPGHDIFLVPAAVEIPSAATNQNTAPPTDEREQSARRILNEATGLDDDAVRKGALEMIAQLYPETQAGRDAAEMARNLDRQPDPAATQPAAQSASEPSDSAEDQAALAKDESNTAQSAETALNLGRTDYRNIQRGLNALGYSAGPVDGIFGTRSRDALRRFQAQSGTDRTGYLTAQSFTVLKNAAGPEPVTRSEAQKKDTTLAALPNSGTSSANPFYGDYIVDIRRRPDPKGSDAGSSTKLVLQLQYRKSANGFRLINAREYALGGSSRSKNYKSSLSDTGALRVSGRTNFLFKSSSVKPFSINHTLPASFKKGKSLTFTAGRFDKNWFVDVKVTRR